jgi:2-polyprenyl-3-methyl-5-hydroxy-6-metoxy-1,4-benzoquinol methylase
MGDMQKHNEKELADIWSREAENYTSSAESSPDYLAHYEIVEEAIGKLKGKKIVDVGSGTGITSAYLSSKGAQLHLVDISQTALDFGKKYFQSKGMSVRCYKQNAFKMNFAPNTFDVAWNGGVIEHFNDDEKVEMMKKMWKIIKPGGVLLITAPNARDLPFMAAKQILIWRKKWAFGIEDDLTIERFKGLALRAGIKKYSIFTYNPIVGWWFFPYGKEITNLLGLNSVKMHKLRSPFGHNVVFAAVKG